jgi:hypothetical protein
MRHGTKIVVLRRLVFTNLLCVVIAAGNMPSWLHVGVCSAELASGSCSSAACQHGSADRGLSAQLTSAADSHSHHDADHCILCQSVGGRETGLVVASDPFSTSQGSEDVCESIQLRFGSFSCSIPHPRGPPSVWA